ncbi:MAG TPA: alpha/beta hydrolase [Alphaproteobacteria bacterium]|nr:alpha/beta hydrolase [Alphaproteobacteria bacterium]
MTISIPAPHAVQELSLDDGARIRLRRHGNRARPRVVLSHGNGFAIDGYFPFWRLLLDDFEVVVFDQRNHGQNPRHLEAHHTYQQVARDAAPIRAAIDKHFGAKPTAGIFHSLSAVANIHGDVEHGVRWDALVLVDPALNARDGKAREAGNRFEHVLAKWARARPECFAGPDELAAQFRASRAASLWLPETAELMARAVTRPAADGGYELCCPGEWEARVYLHNIEMGTWPLLPNIHSPALFLLADPALPGATPACGIALQAAAEFGLDHAIVPGTSHMLQVERPDLCLKVIRAFFAEAGFG